jgi:hypothetical protein
VKIFDLRNFDFNCDLMLHFINYFKFLFEQEIDECFNFTFFKNRIEAFEHQIKKQAQKLFMNHK